MDTERTRQLIEQFLEKLSIEVESVHYIADATHPIFSVRTKDAKKLIGSQGESLRALNFLLKRIVEKRENIPHPSFLVDVNNYQQERNEELRNKAKIMIERVRSFRTSVELDPMNAYERMLVHSMVADDPEIETESAGTGPLKRITIRYKQSGGATPPLSGDAALFS
jgi:predicted RNA-binding protein Jag